MMNTQPNAQLTRSQGFRKAMARLDPHSLPAAVVDTRERGTEREESGGTHTRSETDDINDHELTAHVQLSRAPFLSTHQEQPRQKPGHGELLDEGPLSPFPCGLRYRGPWSLVKNAGPEGAGCGVGNGG